jgi:hypothetical protein
MISIPWQKNHGNHCNPINPGSDNNLGSAAAQFNESAAIQLRKKIMVIIVH